MTSSFLKRKGKQFFQDKKAKVLVLQRNIAGEEIAADEEVTILGRTSGTDIGLNIKSESGIIINNVWCEQLELIK